MNLQYNYPDGNKPITDLLKEIKRHGFEYGIENEKCVLKKFWMLKVWDLCCGYGGAKPINIGGGKGEFCAYLNKYNISTINFEPNLPGNDVSLDYYINKNIKFDLIMFWHSVEHIHNINSTLEKCNKLLSPQGRMLIAIPNHDAYERKYFEERWVAYDLPRHLYHFNFKTFRLLINRHNFTINNYISMYQDTFFNILLSFKSYNFIKLVYILVTSIFNISFDKKKSSSLLYICRKL